MNKNISLLDEKLLDISMQEQDLQFTNEAKKMMMHAPGHEGIFTKVSS
jgi:hypothetical protein